MISFEAQARSRHGRFPVLALVPYAALVVFVVAVVARIVRIVSLPVHLRWELYPVAHERNAAYGGSFFERSNWWQQPRQHRPLGALSVMIPEILLLKGVHEHSRALWWRTYPFHLGLYLGAGFLALLVVGAVAQALGAAVSPQAASLGAVLHQATIGLGLGGAALALVGAVALLGRRLADPVLREHSSSADLFNLVFVAITAAVGLAAVGIEDPGFVHLRTFAQRALTVRLDAELPPPLCVAAIVLSSALFAYIPTTHMAHFFTKWFMYHDVRWNDAVCTVGSGLEARIQRQLGWKVDWSAPHIQGGGTKTWVDVATEPEASRRQASTLPEASQGRASTLPEAKK